MSTYVIDVQHTCLNVAVRHFLVKYAVGEAHINKQNAKYIYLYTNYSTRFSTFSEPCVEFRYLLDFRSKSNF